MGFFNRSIIITIAPSAIAFLSFTTELRDTENPPSGENGFLLAVWSPTYRSRRKSKDYRVGWAFPTRRIPRLLAVGGVKLFLQSVTETLISWKWSSDRFLPNPVPKKGTGFLRITEFRRQPTPKAERKVEQ